MKKVYIILICIGLLSSCNKYVHDTIPEASVDFTIYPNDVTYWRLNNYGGYEYFTGGVRGIIVYRLDESTFLAYDRACPYDWQKDKSWLWVDDSGIIIQDSCCGSMFNILDGGIVQGPALYPLKYYKTRYDGMRLRIYN